MGTWGSGIMESDSAMDIECDMYYHLKIDAYYNESEGDTPVDLKEGFVALDTAEGHARFESGIESLVAYASEQDSYEDQFDVARKYQVLATLVMRNGVKVEKSLWEHINKEALKDPEYIQFAHDIHENTLDEAGCVEFDQFGTSDYPKWLHGRVQALDELASMSQQYDIAGGAALEIRHEGLFEKIFKTMQGQ